MNISINDTVINNTSTYDGQKLDLKELLICMVVELGEDPNAIVQELLNRGVLIKDDNTQKLYIFRKYKSLVSKILLDSDKEVPKITELTELVTKLQELFPKERKCDSHGVPKYAYRGNKRDVTERLQKFFKLYGKYSYDNVLECTKKYVDSFKYDKTYMRILPYYIMKDGESQLATELENMDIEQSQSINDLNCGDALL